MEAGLLRFARNDMKISESHISTSKVSFLNLDSRIKALALDCPSHCDIITPTLSKGVR